MQAVLGHAHTHSHITHTASQSVTTSTVTVQIAQGLCEVNQGSSEHSPIIYPWLKALAMDAKAVPHAHSFGSLYLLGPTIVLTLPQVHK